MMGRVPEVADVHEPNKDTNETNDLCEHVSEVIKFPFQRSLLWDLRSDRLVDVTNSSLLTSKNNNCFGVSIDNGCALRSSN